MKTFYSFSRLLHSALLVSVFFLTILSNCRGQEDTTLKAKYSIGLLPSYASTDLFSSNSYSYVYTAFLLKIPIGMVLKEGAKWQLNLDIIPQIASGSFSEMDSKDAIRDNFEFGSSLGLSLHKKIKAGSLFIAGQVGPHYISDTPAFQSSGFIFSDTVEMGFIIDLGQKFLIRSSFGYRHLSNASLTDMNRGIDNFILALGVSYRVNKLI